MIVVGQGLPFIPDYFGFNMPPLGSPGDNVTTYIPGVSPMPDKGDIIYVPSDGASTVKDVYYDPDKYDSEGNPGGVVIVTELDTIKVGLTP